MSAASGSARQQAAVVSKQSPLYKAIVTPIVFVTFLVSLAVVDYRNSARRSQYHAEGQSSWLPHPLHRLIYRARPYQYVSVEEKNLAVRNGPTDRPYYHSKQRKLMRMEVADAFEMRGWVVLVFGLLLMGTAWGLWRAVSWVLNVLF